MAWETELAEFLTDLSAVQEESLALLSEKRRLLAAVDTEGLAALARQEEKLIERLQGCLRRRQQLLDQAAQEGLPSGSIRDLTKSVTGKQNRDLTGQVREATGRARLLRHQSLVNWVLAQRTLIHLSQMLEIIATGGRMKPTYSKEESPSAGGALVDRVA